MRLPIQLLRPSIPLKYPIMMRIIRMEERIAQPSISTDATHGCSIAPTVHLFLLLIYSLEKCYKNNNVINGSGMASMHLLYARWHALPVTLMVWMLPSRLLSTIFIPVNDSGSVYPTKIIHMFKYRSLITLEIHEA
jgi:hypothetical protein